MESIFKKGFVILIVTSLFACQVDSNCNTINVDFVSFSNVTLDANLEENNAEIAFDSIFSPQTDSVFFRNDTIDSFILPLSPAANQTDFYFHYGSRTDTIRFSYEKRNAVDSPECGIDMEFIGLDTVFQTFDSLVIVNDTLKRTVNAPNIKLYFL